MGFFSSLFGGSLDGNDLEGLKKGTSEGFYPVQETRRNDESFRNKYKKINILEYLQMTVLMT